MQLNGMSTTMNLDMYLKATRRQAVFTTESTRCAPSPLLGLDGGKTRMRTFEDVSDTLGRHEYGHMADCGPLVEDD